MQRRSDTERTDNVTLEDLLRLKRFEKPEQDFWERFDRELEKKRLLTLVNRPSFLRRFAHPLVQRVYPLYSLGAAALLLFGFVAYQSSSVTPTGLPAEDGSLEPFLAETNPSIALASTLPEGTVADMPAFLVADLQSSLLNPSKIKPRAHFGIDIISPEPKTYRFEQFVTDMQPTAFRVTKEQGLRYGKDIFQPDAPAIRLRSQSSPF